MPRLPGTFAPHYRLTCSGTIGNGATPAERFTFGLAMAEFPGPGGPDAGGSGSVGGFVTLNQGQFDDIVADCVALFARPGTGIHSVATLTEVKLATISDTGVYTSDPRIAAVSQPGGTQGGVVYPPQVAMVASLVTARRGPTGKGRFYLPSPAHAVQPDSLTVADLNRDPVATSVALFISNLNNEPGIDALGLAVVVASTKGYNSVVTGVRVGRALDTMRSRRTSLAEDFSAPADVLSTAGE